MSDNLTPKQRLRAFVKTLKDISPRQFELQCELSNGMIGRDDIQPSVPGLSKIKSLYPRLDLNWVICGEGEMLLPIREVQQEAKVAVNGNKNNLSNVGNVSHEQKDCNNVEMVQTVIDTLTRQIEEKDRQINFLLKLLEK